MSSNKENSSESKNKLTEKERQEIKAIWARNLPLMAVSWAVLGIVAYALLNNKINLNQYNKTPPQNLTDIGPRIKFVLQSSTLSVVWLAFCMFNVGLRRSFTPAINPLAGHEKRTEAAKNIFTNSLEQFTMSIFSQLILVTYLEPKVILNVIPVINLLFIVGRITFWLGYPTRRAFGFNLTNMPIIATLGYITYKLAKQYI